MLPWPERVVPMRKRLHELLKSLRRITEQRFALRAEPSVEHASALERQLSLGLEQLWKIEAQLLLPALHPRYAGSVAQAEQEIEVLRDLVLLAERCEAVNRDLAWTVTQRLAALHFARVDDLLLEPGAAGIDWSAMLSETEAWLAQWAEELLSGGDIEDEDRDPVGQPPR